MAWSIPLFDLEYDEREERAVLDVLRSKWLTMGDRTSGFESAFSDLLGGTPVLATANCTASLHMAVRAAGVGPGDEVIVTDLTFVATPDAILFEGGTPVFADVVGAHDLTIDPADVEAKITDRTKAIMVVHYGGYPCRMNEIMTVAEKHGLVVIEDCAHCPGASYEGRPLGTIGDYGCFSFFSNKNLSTGEGGAISSRHEDTVPHLKLMRSHGMTAQTLDRHKGHAWGYDVTELGYNYRMTEIEAALATVQLEKLAENNAKRRQHVEHYQRLLRDVPGLTIPFDGFEDDWDFDGVSAYHLMVVVLPEDVRREDVQDSLKESGIQTSIHYRPIHQFSSSALANSRADGLDRVNSMAERLLTLPLWPGMASRQVEIVCSALLQAIRIG